MLTKGKTMIQELVEKQKRYLDYFFNRLELSEITAVFEMAKNCRGLIALSGVGKSGLVAKKIAATMASTNTQALFLSPMNALHGDLGMISSDDLFLFLSKSGESDELMALLPSLRNKGVPLVAVVSNPDSRLAKACDQVVTLPVERELCPFNMVPTTSAMVQMLFGDLLAIALMQENQLSLDDYALNHPAGKIGKSITLTVGDLMIEGDRLPLSAPGDKLLDSLVELSNKRCGCIFVVDKEGHLLGIFTDGDLRRTLQNLGPKALELPLETLMTQQPRTANGEMMATEAIKVMEGDQRNEVTILPVTDADNVVVGLIKLHDIVQTGL